MDRKISIEEKLASCLLYFNDNEEILIVKRKGGRYGLPGGKVHINLNETHQEALVREVKEETNLTIDISNIIPIFSAYVNGFYCITYMVNKPIVEEDLKQMEKEIIPGYTSIENFIKFSEFMNYNIGVLTSFQELMKNCK